MRAMPGSDPAQTIGSRTSAEPQGSSGTKDLAHYGAMPGDSKGIQSLPTSAGSAAPKQDPEKKKPPRELGGRDGPEPTRFGDWEKAGRCIDF